MSYAVTCINKRFAVKNPGIFCLALIIKSLRFNNLFFSNFVSGNLALTGF